MDGDILNEVLIPVTNISRVLPDGTQDPDEVVNQSQVYITTAGYKNMFAYQKLVEVVTKSAIKPDLYCVLGGTYHVPVAEGLFSPNIIREIKSSETFSEESFGREYISIWAGDMENSFYDSNQFDKHRVLLQPEREYSNRRGSGAFYVIGVDVGRFGDLTECVVIKVTPQPGGTYTKSIVNIETFVGEHFETLAIAVKKLYYRYHARILAIDANGVGAGLIDFMTVSQIDPETGDVLPDFGVENDEDGKYKKQRTQQTELNAMYLIKANPKINTECYVYTKAQLAGGKIKFLIDEKTAKAKLMDKKVGQAMSLEQRADYLMPYVATTSLEAQMMNLIENHEGTEIKLDRATKSIKKDKFSALIYGLYYIKKEEDLKKNRKNRSFADYMFFNS